MSIEQKKRGGKIKKLADEKKINHSLTGGGGGEVKMLFMSSFQKIPSRIFAEYI